jgi:hypothetical protein
MNDIVAEWLTEIIGRFRFIPSKKTVEIGTGLNGRTVLPNIDENYFANCSLYLCILFFNFRSK